MLEGWHPNLTVDEAIALLKGGIKELRDRNLFYSMNYLWKIMDKDGVRLLEIGPRD